MNKPAFSKTASGVWIILVAVTLLQCSKTKTSPADYKLPSAPSASEKAILEKFPGARPAYVYSDSLLNYLNKTFNVAPSSMLLGVSTCVDDIIYTKNFHFHPEIKGPFHLGGLAGLPFTGISGLNAFSHHIPEGGTIILLVEPHIGYSEEKKWGYILRHEQHHASTCCGALMGILDKLGKGTLDDSISDDDYQAGKIAEVVSRHKAEILSAKVPIVELVKMVSKEASDQVRNYLSGVELEHIKYVVVVTGVMINTDHQYTDYQYLDRLSVYDTREKKFVAEWKK
jgi:hypothetical protein